LYILFLSAKCFPILKNVKRVSPKRKIKGSKENDKKRKIKYEPHQKEIKIDHESVHIQIPLLLVYFLQIDCVRLVKIPQSMMIKQFNLDSFML